mmetsp:Transcript_8031/g.11971  ORF Transcript_8031/g.11971 Transcript_8031/m.11971 type:complete len:343 (+) Transcript_8031:76-1104(+)
MEPDPPWIRVLWTLVYSTILIGYSILSLGLIILFCSHIFRERKRHVKCKTTLFSARLHTITLFLCSTICTILAHIVRLIVDSLTDPEEYIHWNKYMLLSYFLQMVASSFYCNSVLRFVILYFDSLVKFSGHYSRRRMLVIGRFIIIMCILLIMNGLPIVLIIIYLTNISTQVSHAHTYIYFIFIIYAAVMLYIFSILIMVFGVILYCRAFKLPFLKTKKQHLRRMLLLSVLIGIANSLDAFLSSFGSLSVLDLDIYKRLRAVNPFAYLLFYFVQSIMIILVMIFGMKLWNPCRLFCDLIARGNHSSEHVYDPDDTSHHTIPSAEQGESIFDFDIVEDYEALD